LASNLIDKACFNSEDVLIGGKRVLVEIEDIGLLKKEYGRKRIVLRGNEECYSAIIVKPKHILSRRKREAEEEEEKEDEEEEEEEEEKVEKTKRRNNNNNKKQRKKRNKAISVNSRSSQPWKSMMDG